MTLSHAKRHLGRNEPCWCCSGRKYKRCHYTQDRDSEGGEIAAAEAARQEERGRHHDHGEGRTCEYYRPTTRSVPAVLRSEFVSLLKRMHSAGSTVLHIHVPEDLARDEQRFQEALALIRKHDIRPHFAHDPQPEDVDAAQILLDRLFAAGSYRLHPGGELFRGRGIVVRPGAGGVLLDLWLAMPLEPRLAELLAAAGVDDLERQGFEAPRDLLLVVALAKLLRDLPQQRGLVPESFRDRIDAIISHACSYVDDVWPDDSLWQPTTAATGVPAGLAYPGLLDAPESFGERATIEDGAVTQELDTLLEEALAAQPDIRQIVELAGDDLLDSPEAFQAWNDDLERVGLAFQATLGTDEQINQLAPGAHREALASKGAVAMPSESAATPRSPVEGVDAPPPILATHPLFDALSEPSSSVGRRAEIELELGQVLESQSKRDQSRQELADELARLDERDTEDKRRLSVLEDEVAALVSSERRERRDALISIVGEGVGALERVDREWAPDRVDAPNDADVANIAAHRQTVVDGEKMRAEGTLAKMPASLRAIVEARMAESRAFLDGLPGGDDVITLPLVVGVEERANDLVFRALIPLKGDQPDELEPGSLAASLAVAVAGALKVATELVDAIDVKEITCAAAGKGSMLQVVTVPSRGAVNTDESSELAAEALREALERNPVLTAARLAWDVFSAPTELSEEGSV